MAWPGSPISCGQPSKNTASPSLPVHFWPCPAVCFGKKRDLREMNEDETSGERPAPVLCPSSHQGSSSSTTDPSFKKHKPHNEKEAWLKSTTSEMGICVRASTVQLEDCVQWYHRQDLYTPNLYHHYDIPLCVDCFMLIKKGYLRHGDETCCRFRGSNLRRLVVDPTTEKRKLNVQGMVTETEKKLMKHVYDQAMFTETDEAQSALHLSLQSRLYILKNVFPTFESLVFQERGFMPDSCQRQNVALKTSLRGFRENCDVCQTSIFDMHFMCKYCGFCVCVDCQADRDMCDDKKKFFFAAPNSSSEMPRDGLNWPACCSNPKDPFLKKLPETWMKVQSWTKWQHDLLPIHIIPSTIMDGLVSEAKEILLKYEDCREAFVVEAPAYQAEQCQSARVICGGQVLWLMEEGDPAVDLQAFRHHWRMGLPVLVSRIIQRLRKPHLWLPETFAERFGQNLVTLVDCSTNPQTQYAKKLHSHFWNGFDDLSARTLNKEGSAALWKMKDWPTEGSFSDILPEHYADLMEALPINSYSNTLGDFNLAKYLPEWCCPPDLGPKMYAAYGSSSQPKLATTNLHVDISDAVNVIVHVGCPQGHGAKEAIQSVKRELERVNVDEDVRDRLVSGERPGALWQIYRPEDAPQLRKFIGKMRKERAVSGDDDPIHCQMEYLDFELRERLKKEMAISAIDIVQFEGDAIFIPANAPHQVAEDFVTPEHVTQCLFLTKQFRKLPNHFSNKMDKLQMKNILFHTVKTMVASFREVMVQPVPS